MSQTEPVTALTLDPVSNKIEANDAHPVKKFKQARLPFMPIEHEQKTLKTTTPPGSKKRKLSDNDSPSAKQAKVSVKPAKPLSPDGEAEVSSSSEADPVPVGGHQKGAKKISTLDRFLYRKREVQEEISSTNDCVPMAIDLTDDTESDSVDSAVSKSEKSSAAEKTGNSDVEVIEVSGDGDTKTVVEKDENKDVECNENEEKESSENSAKPVVADNTENKENIERASVTTEDDDDVNQSFVSDTSVCEAALKTPAKDKPLESVLKTPVIAGKNEVSTSLSQSPGTASDATPVSGKKRRTKPLSESQKKERDAMRQQKEKEREEKRLQKEKEKEEKEKERLEKKKQKEEEKAEKEKQRQEEKDKKEKERLEKLQKKEEEKKKKEELMEAKMEEKRKKDEERKQKEEEKRLKEEEKQKEEEEKLKRKEKIAQSFKSFFIEKTPSVSPPKVKEGKSQFFMPFEMKPCMRLAPAHRVTDFSMQVRDKLDQCLLEQDNEKLYLSELKCGATKKRKSKKTYPRELNVEKDVEIMCHDEETIQKTLHKVKFLKFAENTRPPYYGTWTKPTTKLSARNPFKQDEDLFDYEVDSDDEWEEEDPGESVSSDEEDDDKDKDKDEDEEDADGWMVPHGYLSDDEGIDNEDEMDAAKKHQLQAARQEAWEREIKMQTQPLKMIAVGCVWEGETTAIAAKQLEKLLSYKAVCMSADPIPTYYSRSEGDNSTSQSDKTDSKLATPRPSLKKSVPEEAMPDLIKLLHGNPSGIKKLIKEFRMFWKLKTAPEDSKTVPSEDNNITASASNTESQIQDDIKQIVPVPDETGMEVDENTEVPNTPPNDKTETDTNKTDSQAGFSISIRQLELKIPAVAVREKRSDVKITCWYVKDEVLKQYGMEDIKLPNTWEYVHVKAPLWASANKATPKTDETTANKSAPSSGRATPTIPNIMQFAQTMSPAQIQAQGVLGSPSTSKASIKIAETEVTEIKTENPIEEKPSLPKDQISIKNFFKLATNGPKPTAIKVDDSNKTDESNRKDGVMETGLSTNKAEKVEELESQSMNIKAIKTSPKEDTIKNDTLRVKPLKRNSSGMVENTATSAEKMLKVDLPADSKSKTENNRTVEPMDQDVIVLD